VQRPEGLTDAELRALLVDCLALWGVVGRVSACREGIEITGSDGPLVVQRWLLQTPERRGANRPARAVPSIVALLSALRGALGKGPAGRLRIGGSPR
jgi:hypothetical protein